MLTENEILEMKNYAVDHICPHFASNEEISKCPKIFTRGGLMK